MRWRVTENDFDEINDYRSGDFTQDINFNDLTDHDEHPEETIPELEELPASKRESYSVKVRRSIEKYHERRRLRKDLDLQGNDEDLLD